MMTTLVNLYVTYHHHEWRKPGGSPNVMFFSHRICRQENGEDQLKTSVSRPDPQSQQVYNVSLGSQRTQRKMCRLHVLKRVVGPNVVDAVRD